MYLMHTYIEVEERVHWEKGESESTIGRGGMGGQAGRQADHERAGPITTP